MTVQLLGGQHSMLDRQGLLQGGDVSAHDIGQALGYGRNMDAGSSGPSFDTPKHYNAFCAHAKSNYLFCHSVSVL